MKQIFLKVYPNGKTSTNATVLNFDHEHNTGEIVIDFSEVSYLDWTKQLDLVFADGTHTFVEGTGNTLTVPLLESYLKKGSMTVQPLAKRLVGETYEKIKWQMVALSVRDSLNVLEDDTSITPSVAEQWEIRIQAVEDAEVIRQENENIRISSETLRIENEIARNTFVNYSNSTQYQAGNKVAYQGSSYVAKSDTIGHLPTDTNYWLLIAQKGEQGIQGIQGEQGIQGIQGIQGLKGNQWKGAYVPGTPYVVDDVVSYNGSSYICILASVGNLPTNATYWSLFAQSGEVTTAQLNAALALKANKTQEEWITPTLLNGWENFSTLYSNVGYMKDGLGFVHIRGFIKGGVVGQAIFTLPVGYRLLKTSVFPTVSNASFGYVGILPNGNVSCYTGNTTSLSLELTFKAEA